MLKTTSLAVLTDRKGISSLEYIVLAVFVLGGLGATVGLLTPQLGSYFSTTIPGLL
jgi:hypothetical protein